MAFQPLGYRFEIASLMSTATAVAAIRKRKKRWLAREKGPRGWVVGPFMCLWNSALDQSGPMLVARVMPDGLGTKIVGRAGADLNGTLLLLLLTPVTAWLVFKMVEEGQGSPSVFVTIFVVFGLGVPVTLWINHKDRRDADPLVRFVRRTVGGDASGEKLS